MLAGRLRSAATIFVLSMPGQQARHADRRLGEVVAQRLGDVQDRRLRDAVDAAAGQRGDRRRVHDVTGLACLEHARQERVDAVQHAEDVDAEQPVPVLDLELLHVAEDRGRRRCCTARAPRRTPRTRRRRVPARTRSQSASACTAIARSVAGDIAPIGDVPQPVPARCRRSTTLAPASRGPSRADGASRCALARDRSMTRARPVR